MNFLQKIFCTVSFITIPYFSHTQVIQMNGSVKDLSGQHIPDADVYIANTTIHTTTDSSGRFSLNNVPAEAPFTFIVSRVGYKIYFRNYLPKNNPGFLNIELEPTDTLATVQIDGLKLEKWKKWKRLFIQTFIGDGEFAQQCTILNPEVLRIYFLKEDTVLKIHSVKPLRIQNKALGYIINYDLADYRYNTASTLLQYYGYPYFEKMKGNKRQQNHWAENRTVAYKGSVMQFMRTVYNNDLQNNGFVLTKRKPRIIKSFNNYKAGIVHQLKQRKASLIPKDSISFYKRIADMPDSISKLVRDTLQKSDISFMKEGKLYLHYHEPVQVNYFGLSNEEIKNKTYPRFAYYGTAGSLFSFEDKVPVLVGKDGSYSSPEKFITQGFWAFTEKVSNLLPFDYIPAN